MKGWKIALLVVSWLFLGWLAWKDQPLFVAPTASRAQDVVVPLGDVPVLEYGRMGFTKGIVKASPANDGWVVGTDTGKLLCFDREGRQKWQRPMGLGKITAVAYSNDGRFVLAGEKSPSGDVHLLSAATGEVQWTYSAAETIGTALELRSYPSVARIQTDEAGNYYLAVFRYSRNADGISEYVGRICSLTPDGRVRWRFPDKEYMDAWASWFAVDAKGESLVFATANFETQVKLRYPANLYWLNAATGEQLDEKNIEPITPYVKTVMRGSPNYGGDDRLLAAMASDGRAFLYNRQGQLLWERQISRPRQVGGTWINAIGRDGFPTKHGILFTTINTYNRDNWNLSTPLEHPSSNSVFMFDETGQFRYQWRAAGSIEELDFAGSLAAVAVGRNVRTKNTEAHSAVVLRLKDGTVLDTLATEGPCQSVAISPDEKTVAAIEAPALMPDGRIIGAYRLHIHNLK